LITITCDVDGLKFKLLHNIATSCFQSLPLSWENNITLMRQRSSAFHKVV